MGTFAPPRMGSCGDFEIIFKGLSIGNFRFLNETSGSQHLGTETS
jgi:hypothetical protein